MRTKIDEQQNQADGSQLTAYSIYIYAKTA